MKKKYAIKQTDFDFLFADFLNVFHSIGENEDVETSLEPENYLKRGERLATLAKEKFKREISRLELPKMEALIFSNRLPYDSTLKDVALRIAKVYVRPLLKSMTSAEDKYAKELLESVNTPSTFVRIDFDIQDRYSRSTRSCVLRKKKEEDVCLRVKIFEEGFEPLCVYGMKNTSHGGPYKNSLFSDSSCYCMGDMGELFSYLIIYKQIITTVDSCKTNPSELSERLVGAMDVLKKEYLEEVFSVYPACDIGDMAWKDIFSCQFHEVRYPDNGSWIKKNIYARYDVEVNNHLTYSNRAKYLRERASNDLALICHNEHLLSLLLMFEISISYHSMLYPYLNAYYPLPAGKTSRSKRYAETHTSKCLMKLWNIIAEEKYEQQRIVRHYKELNSSYAKSYMLKQNISKKTEDAMEKSLLNKYFGFVEFDNDTDISKVNEIALEFQAVKETYLKDVDSSQNSIRFRKLGQHKAYGLYYPGVKCLCVDIHSPDSLIHEYGHLIDFVYGNLSNKIAFQEVKNEYLSRLNKKADEDGDFKKVMDGKTKYNYDYYSMPTEIFARCFELYISKCLGVENSIVQKEFKNDGIYPSDHIFLETINNYFSNLKLNRREVGNVGELDKAALKH